MLLYDLSPVRKSATRPPPLPVRQGFRIRPHPSFGFIDASSNDVRLIEADNARVHNLEAGLSGAVWFEPAACVAGGEHKTVLVDLSSGERVVAGGVVLVPQRDGLAALDLKSGKTLWNEKSLGSPSVLRTSKDQAVVGLAHFNRVEYRNLKTGQLSSKIKLPNAGAIPSEAAVSWELLWLACPRIAIFAYRAGKPLWQVKLKEDQYAPRLLGSDSKVCMVEPDTADQVQALDLNSGKKLWSGPVVFFDGYALAGGVWVNRTKDLKTNAVELTATEAGTGKSLWTKSLPGIQWIAVNDRRVAVLSEA